MSSRVPYLQRRGFSLNFRIAVPLDLRPSLGLREVTKTLPTTSKIVGELLALQSAVTVKRIFAELRAGKVSMDADKLAELMRSAREKVRLDALKDEHAAELAAERHRLLQEVNRAKLEGENQGLRQAMAELAQHAYSPAAGASGAAAGAAAPSGGTVGPTTTAISSAPSPAPAASGPSLGKVVGDFLSRHRRDKAAMLKKHQAVLPLFLEVVGDKPVSMIRQADINRFFDVVQKLPPRWKDLCRQQRIGVVELVAKAHPKALSPKSFDDTYKACLRCFLKEARIQWQDEGFPTTLTTEGVAYRGDRKEHEARQRAFTDDELQRLFGGPEMAKFRTDPSLEHQFWLPYVGLYTGARVNEICQINPEVDVLREAKSGIWYLHISEDTEGDERITKKVKNKSSFRKVPIHSHLLSLGFLEYVDRMKANGAKLLLPAFKPGRGRASPQGEKWFRQFLRDIGLRDETPGAKLVGMHAFRHTILHKAFNSDPPLDVTSITGHRGETDTVVAGYQGELSLINKQRILESIRFSSLE